jgi:4-amino-4-deoxy-L-arabinose transferase-like glycosyltransferase
MRSNYTSSFFKEALARQYQQDSSYRFTLETGLFIALLFGSFMVRIIDLNYNTLFLDEAINTVVGEDFLQGTNNRNALTFHFGSYLYPAVSAMINKTGGGVTAMRLASAALMCLTAVFVYFTTRNLFGRKAGLFSMMLFSFNGNILNLGQLAVYDSLALPFLAASLFLLVTATTSGDQQRRLLLASSVCAILAVLSKYIGLIHLPALFLTTLMLFWLKGTPLRQILYSLFIYFVLPIVLALGLYATLFWRELIQVFQEQGFSLAPRWLILKNIGQEIGFILLPALAGLALLVSATFHNQNHNSQPPFWSEQSRLNCHASLRAYRILFFVFFLLLLCSWLAAPLQHWLTANSRSLWKNCAYSLIFLSPLAGYCVAAILESFRSRNLAVNITGMVFICLGIYYFANKALDSNWLFHQSWPNTERVVTYLRNSGLDENSRVLAEGTDIYEYYFSSEINNPQVWNNFWYMEYGGISGQEGALAAIRDHALDFIIIDDYYFPGIRERINPLLAEAGYVVGWQEEQKLRAGDTILLQVFIPGDGGSQ